MTEKKLEDYFDRLWPLCRSITGNGLRESFKILQEVIPLELHEIPTGTQCFDWEIPKEWNIENAYIITPEGKRIAEFQKNNLHIVNYSTPINCELSYDELAQHLHTLPSMPDAIPYVTSYYKENWGFCISHNEFLQLPKSGKYKVLIESSLKVGSLTYGELILKGETDEEILFSTYLCHPSMANNELSGPLCLAFLYEKIKAIPNRKYTYRFVVAPETIGVIAYLAKNGMYMKEKTLGGYVLTCCGDSGNFVFKKSKHENSMSERAALHVLRHQDIPFEVLPFAVGGSDERQYCSPGFNLPVASLTRSMYQKYKEYHTSMDDKSFISFSAMVITTNTYFEIVKVFESNCIPVGKIQFCEPRLSKRDMGLYLTKTDTDRADHHRLLHLLSFADGKTQLLEIAERRGDSIFNYLKLVELCLEKDLLQLL